MKTTNILLACGMLLSAFATSASAQEGEPAEVTEARTAYNQGTTDYELGRYEEAHRHFQRAYEISNLTPLLFNASTTLDRLFRFEDAVASYRVYLERDDAEHTEYVQARIRLLEQRARTPNQVSHEPEALAALEPLPPTLAAPAPSQLPPILMMIGGGAVALASMGPGLAALSIRGDLRERCLNGRCAESDRSDAERMDRLAITSDVLLIVGAGVAVGGLVWFLLRRSEAEPPVSVSCTTDGCMTHTTLAF